MGNLDSIIFNAFPYLCNQLNHLLNFEALQSSLASASSVLHTVVPCFFRVQHLFPAMGNEENMRVEGKLGEEIKVGSAGKLC